jgi:ABC-type multidrug transport system permease subunit
LDAAHRKEYLKYRSSDQSDHNLMQTYELLPSLKIKEEEHQNSLFYEIRILGKRAFTNYWRQIETTAAQITQVVFCSLLVGLLFFDMGTNQNSITSRKGAMFEMMMNIFMLSFAAIACTFPSERPLFLKEKANNIYSTSTYFWSKVLLEFSFQSIWPILYVLIVYFMVGFQASASNLAWFLLISIIVANVASAFALLLGAAVAIPEFTMQMVPFLVVPLTLFTAIMISEDSIPSYYIWMQWISPFHYAFELYCIIEYLGLTFTCTDSEMVLDSDGDYTCAYSTGLSVLESLGIDPDDFSLDLACLFGLMVVYLSIAYWILYRRREKV